MARLLEHGPCGHKLHGNTKGGQYPYYRCTQRILSFPLPKSCDGTFSVPEIDDLVWKSISQLLSNPNRLVKHANKRSAAAGEIENSLKTQIAFCNRELSGIKAKEQQLSNEYASGLLKAEQIATIMNGLDVRRGKVLEKLNGLESELAEKKEPLQLTPAYLEALVRKLNEGCSNASFETKRAVVQMLVEKVVLYPDKALIKIKIPREENNDIKKNYDPAFLNACNPRTISHSIATSAALGSAGCAPNTRAKPDSISSDPIGGEVYQVYFLQ